MSNLSARGVKRICQSEACALPFYDLNRTDISCPNCGTVFDTSVVTYARAAPSTTPSWKRGNRFQRVAAAPVAEVADLPEVEVDDTIEADTDDADADALILEDDTDGEVAEEIKPPVDDRTDV